MSGDFATRIAAILDRWEPLVTDALMATSYSRAPRRTGHFASELYPRTFDRPDAYTWEIHSASQKPKAIWLRDGTSPHMIFPVAAQALAWSSARFAHPSNPMIFAANVHHPGTHADNWGDRVLDDVGPRQLALLGAMIDAA